MKTQEFANNDYTENPVNRCYFSKHELFVHLGVIAADYGFDVVAYGENSSDIGDHRPGADAAKKFNIDPIIRIPGDVVNIIEKFTNLNTNE